MHDCSMKASDCKTSADYAAYCFAQGNEDEARRYVTRLEDALSALKGEVSSLDYVNKKIRDHGPDATPETDH